MTTLVEHIEALTSSVLTGHSGLDQALAALENWLDTHITTLTASERQAFSLSLEQETTNNNHSLVDSILKLHAARLLHRHELQYAPDPVPDEAANGYTRARGQFEQTLRRSEELINEARIDIAIANAHHLLGNITANRRWLDSALTHLNDLAATDLVTMARETPLMPPPQVGPLKRIGLRLAGINLDRLAEYNRDNLALIGQMQNNQIVILAHLLGTSFEAIHERSRARRAFRIAAHLIVRHNGLPGEDADQLLAIAESLQRFESDAAELLIRQAQQNQ
jgi:hypothetical protein